MSQKPNKTMFNLPLSHVDVDYLVLLIKMDIARLKYIAGSKPLLVPAYRLLAKTNAMQSGEVSKEKKSK